MHIIRSTITRDGSRGWETYCGEWRPTYDWDLGEDLTTKVDHASCQKCLAAHRDKHYLDAVDDAPRIQAAVDRAVGRQSLGDGRVGDLMGRQVIDLEVVISGDDGDVRYRVARPVPPGDYLARVKVAGEGRLSSTPHWVLAEVIGVGTSVKDWAVAQRVESASGLSGGIAASPEMYALPAAELHAMHRQILGLRRLLVEGHGHDEAELNHHFGSEPICSSCHGYTPPSAQERNRALSESLDEDMRGM